MSTTDNGGPAFPAPEASVADFGNPQVYVGLTMLDYFAAKAMQALITNRGDYSTEECSKAIGVHFYDYNRERDFPHFVEVMSYRHAKAMLKASKS